MSPATVNRKCGGGPADDGGMMGDRLLEMFLIEEIARLSREINHLRQEIAAFERMLRKIRKPPRRK
jgi:hypothetical protein